MALNFNPFENDQSLKAPTTKKKFTKIKPWESPPANQLDATPCDSNPEGGENKQSHFKTTQNETAQSETYQLKQSQIKTAKQPKKKLRSIEQTEPIDLLEISGAIEEPYLGVPKERSYAELKKLDGDEFKLLFFVTLQGFNRGPSYEIGEGRVRAALPFLAQGTGISRATVARAWKRLQEQGYIKLEVADQRNGFIYRVSPVLYQRAWKKEQSQIETARNETSQIEHASSLKSRRK